MASSIRGGWCLWKEHWHWSHTDKEVFLCISLWTLCHVLSTLLRNSPLNVQSRVFYFKTSALCLSYAAHSKEVTQPPILSSPLTTREATQESPHFSPSLLWLCALEPYLYLTGTRMLASSYPVIGQYRQREPTAEYPANAAWNSVMGCVVGVFVCLMSFYDDDM